MAIRQGTLRPPQPLFESLVFEEAEQREALLFNAAPKVMERARKAVERSGKYRKGDRVGADVAALWKRAR